MSTKTLSSNNHYLKKASATKQIITNVSSSTAIETGKPASMYIKRYSNSGRFVAKSGSTPQKK